MEKKVGKKVPKHLDDDEDRKNPAYIPRKGLFFEHDLRGQTQEEEVRYVSVPLGALGGTGKLQGQPPAAGLLASVGCTGKVCASVACSVSCQDTSALCLEGEMQKKCQAAVALGAAFPK